MTEQVPKAKIGKKAPGPITAKLNNINMTGVNFAKGNFGQLHEQA